MLLAKTVCTKGPGAHFFMHENKVLTLYSGTGTVPEYEHGHLKKGVFT